MRWQEDSLPKHLYSWEVKKWRHLKKSNVNCAFNLEDWVYSKSSANDLYLSGFTDTFKKRSVTWMSIWPSRQKGAAFSFIERYILIEIKIRNKENNWTVFTVRLPHSVCFHLLSNCDSLAVNEELVREDTLETVFQDFLPNSKLSLSKDLIS